MKTFLMASAAIFVAAGWFIGWGLLGVIFTKNPDFFLVVGVGGTLITGLLIIRGYLRSEE